MYNETHFLPSRNSVNTRAQSSQPAFSGAWEVAVIDSMSELFTADLIMRLLVRLSGFRKA